MRNIHFKPLLFSLALTAGLACVEQTQAQEISFRKSMDGEATAIGANTCQSVPVVADFDNNGYMDLYAPGQSWELRTLTDSQGQDSIGWGWYDDIKLCLNNGDGTWEVKNRDDNTGLPFGYVGIGHLDASIKGVAFDGLGIGSCCSCAKRQVKGCPPSAEDILQAL